MSYRLLAHRWPQAVTRDEKGAPITIVDHRQGAIIEDIDPGDVARLLAAGAIEEVGAEDDESPGDGAPTAPVDAGDAAPTVERPAQAAPKEAWESYAVSRGLSADEAKAATKQDLIAALA